MTRSDLISRDELLRYIEDQIDESKEELDDARARGNENEASYNQGEIAEARRIKRHVNMCAPAVDAVPVVHARWEKTSDGCRTRCSSCKIRLPGVWYYNGEDCDENYEEIDATPFCPNCGAKMDGEEAQE